jgi:hypothetical protein
LRLSMILIDSRTISESIAISNSFHLGVADSVLHESATARQSFLISSQEFRPTLVHVHTNRFPLSRVITKTVVHVQSGSQLPSSRITPSGFLRLSMI